LSGARKWRSVRGMPRVLLALTLASLTLIAVAQPAGAAPFAQQARISPPDPAEGGIFGNQVDVEGDTMVVSSPGHENGAVYVFTRPASGSWADATLSAELTSADGSPMGGAAISGDTIVSAAPGRKIGANDSQGAAYVFVKPAGGWRNAHETAVLTASDGRALDSLGAFGIAVSGDTVVVSAPSHTARHDRQGQVYVFVKPAAGWNNTQEAAQLTASDGAANDFLGSVAVAGDTVIAGSNVHKVGDHAAQGQAYVFNKPAEGWQGVTATENATLIAPDGAAGDSFGTSVAFDGNTVVAGAPSRTVGTHGRQGTAYVFAKGLFGFGGPEFPQAELTASDGATNDRLGLAVDVSGTRVVAGAPLRQAGANQLQGAIYAFDRPGFSWRDGTESDLMTTSDGAPSDLFGISVALSGNVVAAGAPFKTVGGTRVAGAAYVLGVPPSIAVDSPADGASFTQGQPVAAAYSCSAPTGSTLSSCTGPVANGAPADTASLGAHSFTVDALDSDGVKATRTVSYTVVPTASSTPDTPPTTTDPPRATAPVISSLRQSASVWRTGSSLARIAATRRRRVGTTFSFRLDQPARLTLRFSARKGRKLVSAGALRLNGRTGANRVTFQGRLSRTRRLRPGKYAVVVQAANSAGQRATSKRLRFTIVK
jgi:hypothetical protein